MSSLHPEKLAQFRREHPRAWTWMVAMAMAGLSLVLGLGVSIYDGVMNPRVAPIFFVLLGLFAFYIPGLLMAVAAVGLRRGWVMAVRLGMAAALVQAVMAFGAAVGHGAVTYFSVLVLLEGFCWVAGDIYVAWRLWLALPWVVSDAEARPGFAVMLR